MSRRIAVSVVTLALLAGTGYAAETAPVATTSPSGTYTLDTSHANVIFNLSHMGYSRYYGRFNALDGTLQYEANAPEKSKIAVTVDVSSIDTNNAKLETELKAADWFDVAKFPVASFTSTRIEKRSEKSGKLYGNLTLHGVTRPVVLDVLFNGGGLNPLSKKDTLGFSAETKISRSEFGVSTYVPMVGDTVSLNIEAEFILQQ